VQSVTLRFSGCFGQSWSGCLTHTEACLKDLAIIMMAAGFITLVFHRFKQPVVLRYILAGIIIGPHTPPVPLISDRDTIQTMADLGEGLLLFSIALQVNVSKAQKGGWHGAHCWHRRN